MIAYGAYVESSQRPEIVRQVGVSPGDYYLVAGRLVPENYADLIVEAYKRARTSKKLLVVGGANYETDFHRRLHRMASDRVLFTGHIHDQDLLKELYCNCFAYIHGHSVGGTNPALLRAMGYGTCILAHDTVFNREVLGGAGLLFPGDPDALATLLEEVESNSELVSTLRQRGPERIRKEYTWDKIAGQYEELFLDVVSK